MILDVVSNVSVFPAKRLAHLTLTNGLSSLFNLSTHQRASLIQLARIYLDLDRSINWNLRLYSREQTPLDQVRSFFFLCCKKKGFFPLSLSLGCISSCFVDERSNTQQLSFTESE